MILQMAASIICCCLPIYRSAFVDIPVLRKLRSKFRSTGHSSHEGAGSNRPAIRTIGQRSTRDKRIRAGDEWLQLDASGSTRHLSTAAAWSDGATLKGTHDGPGYPITQTVELRQIVEDV